MNFWTLQSKKVIEIAKMKGVYYPDFTYSPQQHQNDYQRVLNGFNLVNHTNNRGLVFGFGPEQFLNGSNEYTDVEEIKQLFSQNSFIRNSFAYEPYSLFDENHVLIKIDGTDFVDTNKIPIDYWNHIIVMDGGSSDIFDFQKVHSDFCDLDYATFEKMIFMSIRIGKYIRPIMPTSKEKKYNTMTEIHIPYIKFESIVETYEAVNF